MKVNTDSMIYTKLRRLFAAVAERGGTLTNPSALADAMQVSRSQIAIWFGPRAEKGPLALPPGREGQLLKLFREAGIRVIGSSWLRAPLDEFERLLRESTGVTTGTALDWRTAVWRHARKYDGLRLQRPLDLRGLVPEDEQTRTPIDRFRIGERVQLVMDIPEAFLDAGSNVFAAVVHEDLHESACLFPRDGSTGGSFDSATMRIPDGSLPDGRPRCFKVSGPCGIQQVHVLLSRFRTAAAVHAGLEEIDLQMGLDQLASELAAKPADSWTLLSMAYQVDEAAAA